MEKVESVKLFTCTYKLDRFGDYGADRKCGTTSGVTVEFGEHHAVKVKTVVEFLGGVDRILTCHGVNHKECFLRLDSFLDGCDLLHHLLVNGKTTCGIDNHKVEMVGLSIADCILSYLNGVLVAILSVDRHINL